MDPYGSILSYSSITCFCWEINIHNLNKNGGVSAQVNIHPGFIKYNSNWPCLWGEEPALDGFGRSCGDLSEDSWDDDDDIGRVYSV